VVSEKSMDDVHGMERGISSLWAPGRPAGSFDWKDLYGRVAPLLDADALEEELRRLLDPACATRTIHWGRNYLYEAILPVGDVELPVVIKQFRNHGLRRRVERKLKGSKATRSWNGAVALLEAGLLTPEPLALIESREPEGNSWFITSLVDPVWEVRHFFRILNDAGDDAVFPEVDPEAFLRQLAGLARNMHDRGIVHRDLSMGNILAHPAVGGGHDLYIVDTNRMRSPVKPGLWRRSRDCCRLPIVRERDRRVFLEAYWEACPPAWHPRHWLFRLSVRGYILKHQIKNLVRKRKARVEAPRGGKHHAHIPPAEKNASGRDRIVWDRLSDQPHQHAGRWEKLKIRFADAPEHLGDYLRVLRALPRIYRRYRSLECCSKDVLFDGIGLALRPMPEIFEEHLRAIDELGVRRLLIRLHPWDEDHREELRLARALADRGHELAFALPQNRELVRDPSRWKAAIEEIAGLFTPYGSSFQLCQAVNRSKWGIWRPSEYQRLVRNASEILRRYPGVEILGPSVIDFEFQATIAHLHRPAEGIFFDAVSSLLYVDRRGAPENTQLGLDTRGKVRFLKAICETSPMTTGRSWITEVNWPLWEGPHSPAGRCVSVDEETQADYLVRYFILTLASGFVERVYWWRLAARGYGLATLQPEGTLRRRPSWHAMRTLVRMLDGARFEELLPVSEGAFLYSFSTRAGKVVAGWSLSAGVEAELPRSPSGCVSRDGVELRLPAGSTVELGPSVRYFLFSGNET